MSAACIHRWTRRPGRPRAPLLGAVRRLPALHLLLAVALGGLTCGARKSAPEAELKAALLYNFARFTEWPAATLTEDAELTIAVLGQGADSPAVETLDGRRIAGHRIVARRVRVDEIGDHCQVVYVGKSEQTQWPGVQSALAGLPVLLVSDIESSTRGGAVVRVFWVGNRIRFEINVAESRRRSLRLAPELLSLAEIYQDDATRGGDPQ